MRGEKEIREALKRLKEEHLRRGREPATYSPRELVTMISVLEWVLGEKQNLPDLS